MADLDYARLLALTQVKGPGLILFRGGNYSEHEAVDRLRRTLEMIPDEANSIVINEKGWIRRETTSAPTTSLSARERLRLTHGCSRRQKTARLKRDPLARQQSVIDDAGNTRYWTAQKRLRPGLDGRSTVCPRAPLHRYRSGAGAKGCASIWRVGRQDDSRHLAAFG